MNDDDAALLRVATALTDGAVIDWDSERKAHEALRGPLRRLQEIQHLMAAQQSPQPAAESGRDPKITRTLPSDPSRADARGSGAAPLPFSTWGPLQILGRLDEGGHGEVLRARDPALQKEVALKLLRSEPGRDTVAVRKSLEEARRLARVRHPNVLAVHGVATHNGRAGLWTDLIEGRTLEQLLEAQGALGWEEAAVIGGTLCQALAAVHAQGLVHHDVKTTNVMREEGGRIVLMDFSTASDRLATSSRPGDEVVGTPRFMAPERFTGIDSGPCSDVYSLGVVLFRLVTRRFPVEAGSGGSLADRIARGTRVARRDARPDLPPAFVEVVERALEPDPDRRFATMGEMERALSAARGRISDDGTTKERSLAERLRSVAGSVWFRAAAAVVVLGGAGLLLLLPPGRLEVEAALYRRGEGLEERLLPGGKVSVGDSLFLEIRGSEPMHVYVLNGDRTGNAFVLFPLPGFDLKNPLPGGQKYRLPGTLEGRSYSWTGTSSGGSETFVVIASRTPLKDFEAQIGRIQTARLGAPTEIGPEAMQVLRGFGGLAAAPPAEGDSAGPFPEILRGLSRKAAGEKGLWVWEIELENPGA